MDSSWQVATDVLIPYASNVCMIMNDPSLLILSLSLSLSLSHQKNVPHHQSKTKLK